MSSIELSRARATDRPGPDDGRGVRLVDRVAMHVGLRLLLWGHERAAHRRTADVERFRSARDEAIRRRDLLIPQR